MKHLRLCLLLLPFVGFAQPASKKFKVLFLGNSYTYFNNLPQLIHDIALANNDTLVFDGNLIGGYTLNDHFNDATSIAKISQGGWDYVVLQGQSQEPAFPPAQVAAQTFPFAIKLDSVIKAYNACATTVFYETWGYKTGDASNCAAYPPLCTYTGMQNRLRQSYKLFADSLKALMAPAGEAYRSAISYSPALELYNPDQSHPELTGSYMTACVFYETLFQKSVLSNTYNPGIPTNTLTFLQQRAHATVNDSLNVWNLGVNYPWAAFTNTVTGQSVQFSSYSPGLNNAWDFGDNTQATTANASHAYAMPGTYQVCHSVNNNCQSETVCQTVVIGGSVGWQELPANGALQVYPNPCTSELRLQLPANISNAQVQIRDISNRLIYSGIYSQSINTGEFENGLYFISLRSNNSGFNSTFIKH